MALNKTTEIDPIKIPKITHTKTPIQNSEYMMSEISCVEWVFQTLMTWGIKEMVVNDPAKKPIHSVIFSFSYFY